MITRGYELGLYGRGCLSRFADPLSGHMAASPEALVVQNATGLTDGNRLEVLLVAELSLTLPVHSRHSNLVRRVGLQPRQHHGRCRERRHQSSRGDRHRRG